MDLIKVYNIEDGGIIHQFESYSVPQMGSKLYLSDKFYLIKNIVHIPNDCVEIEVEMEA